jgi:hypothetical protein
MISLSDEEMDAITELAAPILPSHRGAFLEAVAVELQAHPDAIGVGSISRVGRQLQPRFLRHPSAVQARGPARHRGGAKPA